MIRAINLLPIASIALCVALTGCFETFTSAAPAPAPIIHACPAVRTITPAEQKRIATAIAAEPADSPIPVAMQDYVKMRDEARACAAK